jgi:hypothetical protein
MRENMSFYHAGDVKAFAAVTSAESGVWRTDGLALSKKAGLNALFAVSSECSCDVLSCRSFAHTKLTVSMQLRFYSTDTPPSHRSTHANLTQSIHNSVSTARQR